MTEFENLPRVSSGAERMRRYRERRRRGLSCIKVQLRRSEVDGLIGCDTVLMMRVTVGVLQLGWHRDIDGALSPLPYDLAARRDAAIRAQAAEGAKVIEGVADTAALPAAALEEPHRLLEHVNTAIGPKERKPRKRVPSPPSQVLPIP
jgi:hypothetical protein